MSRILGDVFQILDGRVGIATTNPVYKLDVYGDINYTGTLYQNGLPSAAGGGGGGSLWSSNGAKIYYNAGNVGIGSGNPAYKLDVVGPTYISGPLTVNNTIITNNNNIDSGSGTITAAVFSGTATQVSQDLIRGSYLTGNNYNGSVATTWAVDADSANTANKVVVRDASGNFSAGTITANALNGTTITDSTSTTSSSIAASATAVKSAYDLANAALPQTGGTVTGSVVILANLTTSNLTVMGDTTILNTISSNTEQMVINNAGTGPALKVTQSGNYPVAEFYDNESGLAMTIANNGNIGIGTTVARTQLDIIGNILLSGNVGMGTNLSTTKFHMYAPGNTQDYFRIDTGAGGIYGVSGPFLVDRFGNVGIGLDTPTAALHVNGGVQGGGKSAAIFQPGKADGIVLQIKGFSASQTGNLLEVYRDKSSSTPNLIIDGTDTNLGIGTTVARQKLDIIGNALISGNVTAGSFLGTATQVSQNLTRGTYLTGNNYNGSVAITWAVDADSANTASKVVVRDASGNFSAGTITATLSGTATQVSQNLTRGSYLTGNNYNGSVATTWAVDADSANTASTVVARDASGNFSAGTITASLNGTATQVDQNLTRGTYLTGNNYNGSVATTWAVDADSANTASTVVARDASGNFSAGIITATLNGTATQVSSTLTRGSYLTGSDFTGASSTTWAVDATTTATANKIVARDASGNIYAANIGIGTDLPQSSLHVIGDIRSSQTIYASNLQVTGLTIQDTITSNTQQLTIVNEGSGPALIVKQTGVNYIAEFYHNDDVILALADGGLIGINTATPRAPLDIIGDTILTGNIGFGTTQALARLYVRHFDTGTDDIFRVDNTNTNSTSLIVDHNGNVGIGTSQPKYSLDVYGNAKFTGSITSGSFLGTATQVSQNLTRGTYLTGNTYNGSVATTWAVDADSANSVSKVVARDASGNFSAGTITATLTGTATQVSQNLTRGTYLTGNTYNGSEATTWAVDADSANTASKVVVRDASGNFSAGTITATLTGTATQVSSTLTRGSYLTGSDFTGASPTTWAVDATTTATANKIVARDASAYLYASGIGIGTTNATSALHVDGNVFTTGTITASNISVIGDFVTMNTVTSNTEQMIITNEGTGPALKVTQTGPHPIAEFYDDNGAIAFKVANDGLIGIGTTTPRQLLDVQGGPAIFSANVGIGTTTPRQLLDVQGGPAIFSANVGIGTTNPLAYLHIGAGTATVAPIRLTSGTNLTSAKAGSIEYDGGRFYGTTAAIGGNPERGYLPSIQMFRLSANGSAIGPTIANFFGATSGVVLGSDALYELEAYCYFTKTTAGTVTVTLSFSSSYNNPQNLNAILQYGAAAGGTATGAANQIAIFAAGSAGGGAGANIAFGASASLTTAVNHAFQIRSIIDTANGYAELTLKFTSSAGTVTPLRGSYYKVTRIPTTNTGSFV